MKIISTSVTATPGKRTPLPFSRSSSNIPQRYNAHSDNELVRIVAILRLAPTNAVSLVSCQVDPLRNSAATTMVTIGTKIQLPGRAQPYAVTRLLGAGGEGDVYEMRSADGDSKAIKWYHEQVSIPERRAHISSLVDRGAPSAGYLWPLALVEDSSTGRFGYVMDLRPEGYVDLASLLKNEVARNEISVIRFTRELAQSYLALHTHGLCYRDINFGNAFLHPETGHALICDNDNVGVDGVGRSMVLGAPRFMAPEILGRQMQPSKYTDRFSLAVLLFYLFVGTHPLDGARTNGQFEAHARMKHYVLDPLFCFDPNDQQNRPIPEPGVDREQIWRRYPTRIRDLFTRSFTIGLHHPAERVVDAEWCEALAELEDHYFECPNCSQTRFIDEQRVTPCGNCGDLRATPALCVRGFHIVVRPGARISADRLRGDFDYGTVMAEVESHPTVEGLLGIKNLTLEEGGYLDPRGTTRALLPGKRAGLIEGAEVKLAGRRIRLVELRPDGDCCL